MKETAVLNLNKRFADSARFFDQRNNKIDRVRSRVKIDRLLIPSRMQIVEMSRDCGLKLRAWQRWMCGTMLHYNAAIVIGPDVASKVGTGLGLKTSGLGIGD
jgi:hypothetical protein